MSMTHFFRLLKTDIDAKGARLAEQVQAVNAGQPVPDAFAIEPTEFKQIPGSPFAYWVSEGIRKLFTEMSPLKSGERFVKQGLATADDFRFLRVWWEVTPGKVVCGSSDTTFQEFHQQTCEGRRWVPFSKGGAYSPYYADLYLVVNWEQNGAEVKNRINPESGRPYSNVWMLKDTIENCFFHPGLTWPNRPHKRGWFSHIPKGAMFGHNGSMLFLPENMHWIMCALLNSNAYIGLLNLLMSRGGVQSGQTLTYEVGLVGSVPIPYLDKDSSDRLRETAIECFNLFCSIDSLNETSHVFQLPACFRMTGIMPSAWPSTWQVEAAKIEQQLVEYQQVVDDCAFQLYKIQASDRQTIEEPIQHEMKADGVEDDTDNEDSIEEPVGEGNFVSQLFSHAVGCAFGRWDVRFALDPTLLPKLQDPFDPLPRCSPGMLVGPDGLPATRGNIVSEAWLRARPNAINLPDAAALGARPSTIPNTEYPLPIAWFGIIPDDDSHPEDIVQRVRGVLELLWGDRADAIEQEACDILGVQSLRDYFRQPRAFFDFHIKRYSKSRRKAPIYWLLQSAKRNYGLWLYYPRMDPDTLFKALTLYADPKLALENIRLGDLRAQLTPDLAARDRRALDKAIAKQEALIGELRNFRNELERVARLGLPPDMNDGVIISIAPLHNLVPWKEAEKMWAELEQGKYEWSSMSRRMRERGLVKKGKG